MRPAFLAHPRLRRTSPITQYAAAAALEAAGPQLSAMPQTRFGLIFCLQSGPVQYATRFFGEVVKDPATASPLAFPETVFAAPTSHIATLLGNVEQASSLIGDPASYLQGLALGADWLLAGMADLCLITGAEESHWLLADALWHFQHGAVSTSGAGAVCLSCDPRLSMGVELDAITDAHTFNAAASRALAAQAMRAQLPPGSAAELLCDGLDSCPRADAAERGRIAAAIINVDPTHEEACRLLMRVKAAAGGGGRGRCGRTQAMACGAAPQVFALSLLPSQTRTGRTAVGGEVQERFPALPSVWIRVPVRPISPKRQRSPKRCSRKSSCSTPKAN